MTTRSRTTLKTYYNTGDTPSETNFADFIDTAMSDVVSVALSNTASLLSAGTTAGRWEATYDGTLSAVYIDVNEAPTGSTIIVDVNKGGVSMLSTLITIDAGETSSRTAATPPVISTSTFSKGDVITWDIDQVGSSSQGKWLIGHLVTIKDDV